MACGARGAVAGGVGGWGGRWRWVKNRYPEWNPGKWEKYGILDRGGWGPGGEGEIWGVGSGLRWGEVELGCGRGGGSGGGVGGGVRGGVAEICAAGGREVERGGGRGPGGWGGFWRPKALLRLKSLFGLPLPPSPP